MRYFCTLALALSLPAFAGADPNASQLSAGGSGDRDAHSIVLAAGTDPNAKDDDGSTPLHAATREGDARAIDALLAAGADPNISDVGGDTPLHAASGDGSAKAIDAFLAAGADPNTRVEGITPLHAAAGKGHVDAIHILLAAGADPNASAQGVTPTDLAAEMGHTEAVDALAAADSLPSTTSGSGNGDATDWPRRRFRIFRLKDSHGYNKFTLIYNRRKVAIDGMRMRLSLTRRECNAHILDRFNADMARLIGDFTRRHNAGLETTEYFMMDLRIQIDGNYYVWSDDVRTGHDFLHLPREIHRMKWEEKFNCSRDQESGKTR